MYYNNKIHEQNLNKTIRKQQQKYIYVFLDANIELKTLAVIMANVKFDTWL